MNNNVRIANIIHVYLNMCNVHIKNTYFTSVHSFFKYICTCVFEYISTGSRVYIEMKGIQLHKSAILLNVL